VSKGGKAREVVVRNDTLVSLIRSLLTLIRSLLRERLLLGMILLYHCSRWLCVVGLEKERQRERERESLVYWSLRVRKTETDGFVCWALRESEGASESLFGGILHTRGSRR